MLFNSYSFIFLFLPSAFAGVFLLGRINVRLAALWLALASLAFYAVWDARFVLLLMGSVVFNYFAGYWIGAHRSESPQKAKYCVSAAITINLLLLGYFKYTNFFIFTSNHIFNTHLPLFNIILPIGISFFTFTQIAFVVDAYRGIAKEYNFINYLLFVTYFPHLIAGPVLHHKQMMPQFADSNTYHINFENIAVGLTIFILGLAKKVLLADQFAEFASPVFNAAQGGATIAFIEGWTGALAYTLQLYFDFSGYSDMAIGLSLLFNVRLPLNFDSPYKAANIIDFWRRWHMTLSAFLRDYLYVYLGGNRKGPTRRYINLMATILLGGLWHGAGWTFIVWGGLHGLYLMANHGWREVKVRLEWKDGGRLTGLLAKALTFLAVVVAWVFFRADSLKTALSMLKGMASLNGLSLSEPLAYRLKPLIGDHIQLHGTGFTPASSINFYAAASSIVVGLAVVWLLPNVRQMMVAYKPTWEDLARVTSKAPIPQGHIAAWISWRPTKYYAWAIGILFVCELLNLTKVSEFLYFQF